jgi:thiamine biosynthesis lipoprotein
VAVDPSLFEVIVRSLEFARMSDGRFDITVGPLVRSWRTAYEEGRLPSMDEVQAASRCVGHAKVRVQEPDLVRLDSRCMSLDLGGIGKGYAVDRAMRVLEAAGISDAVVNAGGSTIAAIGTAPGEEGWPVRIGSGDSEADIVWVRDAALSTSSQERMVYAHGAGVFGEIVDPQRSAPSDTRLTVSVVAATAMDADALSTTLLLSSMAEGEALLAQVPGAAAVWATPNGPVAESSGMARHTRARGGTR